MKDLNKLFKKHIFDNKTNFKLLILLGILLVVVIGYILTEPYSANSKENKYTLKQDSTLKKIEATKTLNAIIDYSSSSYFIYKGQPMGFQYELLKKFAKENGWKLKLIILDELQLAFDMVNSGEADLLAADITNNKKRSDEVLLTEPHSFTKQVLVQRKKKNNEQFVDEVLDLNSKRVYVEKGTVFKEYLNFLSNQMDFNLKIIEDSTHNMEQLVLMVAKGLIDYTVCDEHVAQINKTYLPNLNIDLELSPNQALSWAVGKGQTKIHDKINKWLIEYKTTVSYKYAYSKYFKMTKTKHMVDDEFNTLRGGNLSPYDELIKAYSAKIDWDWRLLASLIYQESRFDPQAKSWAGAQGLMQLMPNTASRFGVYQLSSPSESLKAGVEFLAWLNKQLKDEIPDSNERKKFIIAAYNSGLGHVLDAQALAFKYGKDPTKWDSNVDTFIVLKSNPKYYSDDVVKYGYCRGTQVYTYVEDIFSRYDQYKGILSESQDSILSTTPK